MQIRHTPGRAALSSLERLKLLHLLYFSKPATDRAVYRKIRRFHPRTIVEIGVGTARRSLRMLWLASRRHPAAEIRFTGIDRFEDRPADHGPGFSLREAHRLLKATGARIQLAPGDADEGLARVANGLGQVDLLLFAAGTTAEELAGAWFYVPRLLHDRTLVFLEQTSADGGIVDPVARPRRNSPFGGARWPPRGVGDLLPRRQCPAALAPFRAAANPFPGR